MHFVDHVDLDPLIRETDHLWVSLLMPTHRSGPETTSGPVRMKNLLRDAHDLIADGDHEWLDGAALPLLEDSGFWQNQTEGLAAYLTPHSRHLYHVSMPLQETVRVSGVPHLAPLVPLFGRQREFAILQLSLNQVRLFDVVGESIEEADLGSIPASVEGLHGGRDHQVHLQFTSQGAGAISYHGHGADSGADQVKRERFLRHVARGLEERLDATANGRPVLLACPDQTAEMFAQVSDHPHVSDLTVPGAADGLTPHTILQRAQPVMDAYRKREFTRRLDHLDSRTAQRRVESNLVQIVLAAEYGRVETLFVEPDAAHRPSVTAIDRAMVGTLRNSGDVLPAPGGVSQPVIATLRY